MRLSARFLVYAFTAVSALAPLGAVSPSPVGKAPPMALSAGATVTALDSLNCTKDAMADAQDCLQHLQWQPTSFTVTCETARPGYGDWLIRFPSPFPSGDATNDLVAMEWLMAKDEHGQPKVAPAVVVVHESGKAMVAGRAIARGLRNCGVHTFLIHLPGYGERMSPFTTDMKNMLPGLRQAVSDVRRARDAVAMLPFVDRSRIAVQGTSLGGFITATVAGLDRGYDQTFILLAGGQIAEVLLHGKQDAARMRQRFAEVGVTDDNLRELAKIIEPMRLAHRVDPQRTWLFSGKYDDVVPPACSEAFAKAAKLGLERHLIFPVGHYSAALLLPAILPKVGEIMLQRGDRN